MLFNSKRHQMMRTPALLLVLVMAVSCFAGGTVFADEAAQVFTGKSVIFSSPAEANGITVWTGDGGTARYSKIDDKPVIHIGDRREGSDEPDYVYVSVDPRYCPGEKNKVIITVEYFDEEGAEADWSIAYDSVNAPWRYLDPVSRTNSGTWKTHTFELNDARFDKRCNGADFRVSGHGAGIAIHKITVEKIDSIIINAKSTKMANQFFEGERVKFDVSLINEKAAEETLDVSYRVVDPNNFVLFEGAFMKKVGAGGKIDKSLDLGVLPKGAYHLLVDASNEDKTIKNAEKYRFGVIKDLSKREFTIKNFGACTHFAQGKGNIDVLSKLYKQAGMLTLRDEYYWGQTEPTKGNYQWAYDAYVNKLTETGHELLICLTYGNSNYTAGGGLPLDDVGRKGFANYAANLAKHLEGKTIYFEVWNEWNGGGGSSAENYYLLLKETYEAVKAVSPTAYIVGCGAVGYDYTFLTNVVDYGGWKYMDAISYHYPDRTKFNELAHRIQKYVKDKYDKDIKAWVTEIGWANEHVDKGGKPETLSAGWGVQLYIENHTDPTANERVYYYDFQNDGVNPAEHEDNFGLVTLEADGAPKPIFVAFNAVADLLNGTTYAETYETNVDGVYMRRFASNNKGEDIIALWSNEEEVPVSLNMKGNNYRGIDSYGNAVSYEAINGEINLTVKPLPVYFAGRFAQAPTLGESCFAIEAENLNVVPGDEFAVEVTRSGGAVPLSGRYKVSVPDGWNVVSGNTFSAGSSKDKIVLRVGEGYTAPTGRIEVTPLSKTGNVLGNVGLETKTADVFVAEFRPVLNENKDGWNVQAKLINNYTKATIPKGTLTVVEPKDSAGVYEFDEIPPSGVTYIDIPAPMLTKNWLTQFTMNLRTDDGVNRNILRSVSALTVPKVAAGKSINIDGDLSDSEWEDAVKVYIGEGQAKNYQASRPWGGDEDLSAMGMYKWDDEFLYFAVEVTDNVQFMEDDNWLWAWQGDSLQYSIDPGRALGYNSIGGHRLIASVNSKTGDSANSVEHTDLVGGSGEMLSKSLFAGKRDEANKKTRYEMALKWSEILPSSMLPVAENETCIGFSFLHNDNDGDMRYGWVEYMSGIGMGKSPAQFGDLILTNETSIANIKDESDSGTSAPKKPVNPDDFYVAKEGSYVPQSKMKIISSTPHDASDVVENIFDPNKSTRYQIRHGEQLPHSIVIDLGGMYEVDAIDYWSQKDYDGGTIFKYSIYMGNDPENLTKIVDNAKAPEFIIGSTQHTVGEYRLEFPDDITGTGRYLKLEVTDSKYGDLRISNLNVRYKNAIPNLSVMLNNRQIEFDREPVLEGGRTLVPVRAIFEAMGATVDWDEASQTVTATKGNVEIKLTIDDTKAYKNGAAITLDVPSRLLEGRTFVPVRFIAESFDATVDFNEKTQVVSITTE